MEVQSNLLKNTKRKKNRNFSNEKIIKKRPIREMDKLIILISQRKKQKQFKSKKNKKKKYRRRNIHKCEKGLIRYIKS